MSANCVEATTPNSAEGSPQSSSSVNVTSCLRRSSRKRCHNMMLRSAAAPVRTQGQSTRGNKRSSTAQVPPPLHQPRVIQPAKAKKSVTSSLQRSSRKSCHDMTLRSATAPVRTQDQSTRGNKRSSTTEVPPPPHQPRVIRPAKAKKSHPKLSGTMGIQNEKSPRVVQISEENLPSDSLSGLVSEEVSLDKQDEDGWTQLHHASYSGNLEKVRNLLENNAKINVRNNKGETPCHIAAKLPQEEVMLYLLDRGAALDDKDDEGQTALHHAGKHGQFTNVRCLLERGAKPDIQNKEGKTPLHLAAEQGKDTLFLLVLLTDMDFDTKDHLGRTALHYAALAGSLQNLITLLKKSVYVDSQDKFGNTPLHMTSIVNFFEGAKYLLLRGASTGLKDNIGCTAYQLCMPIDEDEDPLENVDFMAVQYEYCKQFLKLKLLNYPIDERTNTYTLDIYRDVIKKEKFSLKREVQRIKSKKISEDFSLFDLFEKSDKPTFLLDEDLSLKLETFLDSSSFLYQFPEYGHILRTRFRRSKLSRFYLTHQAKDSALASELQDQYKVNHDVWKHILSFLPKEDLISIARYE